jgi:hypothetical protein
MNKLKPISEERIQWEVQVTELLALRLKCDYGDAAGVVEAQQTKLDESWEKQLSAKTTVLLILRIVQGVVFNVKYFNKEGEQIDQTQIDEKNNELAWQLFKEFGHEKDGHTLLFEEVEKEA